MHPVEMLYAHFTIIPKRNRKRAAKQGGDRGLLRPRGEALGTAALATLERTAAKTGQKQKQNSMGEDGEADTHCQWGAQRPGHRRTQVAPLPELRVASLWDRAPRPPAGVDPGLTRSTAAPVTVAKGEASASLSCPRMSRLWCVHTAHTVWP